MISMNIPNFGHMDIENVIFDYNGTIALDGELIKGVKEEIAKFSNQIKFHVITADTFGSVEHQLKDVDVTPWVHSMSLPFLLDTFP